MRTGLIKSPRVDVTDLPSDSGMALAEVTLSRAEAFLQSTLDDTDHLDSKALHLTVGDIAAFTILVTFKKNGWLWLAPELLLAGAAFFFYLVFKPRGWELGPDPEAFRAGKDLSPSAIKQSMMRQVLWAAEENWKVLIRKSRYFRAGYTILGVGLALSFVLAIADH